MKKLFYVILFNLYLVSGFSQEQKYGYLYAYINDTTTVTRVREQLRSNNENLNNALENFKVFSFKYPFPKIKDEYLSRTVAIECNCDIKELAEFLKKNFSKDFSDIEYGQGGEAYPDYAPSDAMWYQTNPDGTPVLWHLNKIEADKAWDITKSSSNITVAIIDRGFDISHPDLANKIVSTTDSYTGNPFRNYTGIESYHGTFCASCAGAETDGGGQLASVGFNTMLRFYDYVTTSGLYAVTLAYDASFDKGADILSFSWGGLTSATTQEKNLVKAVLDNGTVIVRSAGNTQDNSDNDRFPFAYQVDNRIIIVTSTDKDDCHSRSGGTPHANYPQVSICSPGYDVMGAVRYNNGSVANPYKIGSGTSYATPIVAGVCALLKSINKNLTPAEIKNIIKTTADPVADANLYPGIIGAGRVNANNAVQYVCNYPYKFTDKVVTSNTTINYCGDIYVEDVSVQGPAQLELRSDGKTIINGNFNLKTGARLNINPQ
ncbi:MAG: S8 family serine peptidase [Dysgonamonadaceae bacterium]|jgi:thermitase|nr:S8 family serine peptidase [Dysgonamonadaceae bacterium]